tara:strand:+ start:1005 stop:1214 length:210 start_codon:yes stop_codon:yes gene_type:complete
MERLKKQYREITNQLIEGLKKNINNPNWVDGNEYYKLQTDLRDVSKQIDILNQKEYLGEEEYNNQINSF